MKVEELKRFGGKIEMPKEVLRKQGWIILKAMKRQFGVLGIPGVFLDMALIARKLRKQHPEAARKAAALGEVAQKELFTFAGLFLAMARRMGRDNVYDYFKTEIIHEIAHTSMRWLYQLDDLKKCDGGTFENFKKMNIAMFKRSTRERSWIMQDFQDAKDKLTIKINTCANVELFTEIGVPELARFGCDHDIAAYPLIEKEVDSEFRRLKTIANGDGQCVFEFYRLGTAPDNAHLNV